MSRTLEMDSSLLRYTTTNTIDTNQYRNRLIVRLRKIANDENLSIVLRKKLDKSSYIAGLKNAVSVVIVRESPDINKTRKGKYRKIDDSFAKKMPF